MTPDADAVGDRRYGDVVHRHYLPALDRWRTTSRSPPSRVSRGAAAEAVAAAAAAWSPGPHAVFRDVEAMLRETRLDAVST